ncbi:MAG: Gx transporter family protein [Treponema sp.]|nr:Gx transporter family protein [Treponema sp.]
MEEKKSRTEMTDELAFFGGLCLFLSAVEYAIPKPLPFLRLGLANLPVLISLKKFPAGKIFLLLLIKILSQALIGGTLFSYVFVFSLSGTLSSGILMLTAHRFLFKKNLISNVGLSMIGALGNAFSQIVCARFLLFGDNAFYIAPLLIISSTVTGFLLGLFSNLFEKKSRWFKLFMEDSCCKKNQWEKISGEESEKKSGRIFNMVSNIVAACLLLAILLIPNRLLLKWLSLALMLVLLEIKKRGKVRILPPFFIVASIILSNLFLPLGKVLFSIGKLEITQGAIFNGLERSVVLCGFLFFSQLIIDKRMRLPGKLGRFFKKILAVFDMLSGEKIRVEKAGKISGLMARIDERLLFLYGAEDAESGEEK